MKKNILYSLALLAIGSVAMTGCSDDPRYVLGGEGEGRVILRTAINSDVKVKSRTPEENAELAAKTTIWISNSKGVVRKYNGIDEVPVGGFPLLTGNYVAEAWAGDSVPASFTDRWFKGREEFTVEKGTTKQVEIVCKIANSVVSVAFDAEVAEVLDDYKLEVGHKAGTLEFNADNAADAKGYFMMPSFDPDLHYTLTGVKKTDGQVYSITGTIVGAKPATEYRIRVRHDGSVESPVGGAFFEIVVEETPVEVEDRFEITSAPVITGIGFDITKPVIGQEGIVGRKSVWVASSSFLQEVEISCPAFGSILGISGNDFELYHMSDEVKAALDNMEFTWVETRHDDTGMQELRLNFPARLLDQLPSGEHNVVIRCLDVENRESTATMRIVLSDAKAETIPVDADSPAIWATSVVLTGRVMKDDAVNPGIEYRAVGAVSRAAGEWMRAYPEKTTGFVAGEEYTVTLTGLAPGTTYEYRSIAEDFEGTIATFATETATQLPNSGFENWFIEEGVSTMLGKKNVQRIGTDKATLFWDSGNEGAATGNATLTSPDSELKHGGNFSAKLASKAVVGRFAAGNIFIGQYLKTDGMDGVLGWGRPFTTRPKALKLWVRYQGGTVDKVGDSAPGLNNGDRDEGIVYIALCDNQKTSYEGSAWSCVVKTKSSDRHLFSKDDANVIAYGEHVFTADTDGSGLVQIEIPLDYRRTDIRPSNIIMVAAASRGGDYFTGSSSSVMWLDDLELVY